MTPRDTGSALDRWLDRMNEYADRAHLSVSDAWMSGLIVGLLAAFALVLFVSVLVAVLV